MRDQEVLRANKELAAYFRGNRTEREARAALKIIKAFVRDRERRDVGSRPPLPGTRASTATSQARKRPAAARRSAHPIKKRPQAAKKTSARTGPPADPSMSPGPETSGAIDSPHEQPETLSNTPSKL
jgi:hypothetical protein